MNMFNLDSLVKTGGRKHTQRKHRQGKLRNRTGGTMLVDVAASALLLAATQLMKGRSGTSKYVKNGGSRRRRHRRR